MSSSFFDALPLEQQRLLDRLCDEFEQAWAAGQRPSIERFLEQFPEQHRAGLLPELVALEVQLRVLRNEQPRAEEYLERFPTQSEQLAALSCFAPLAGVLSTPADQQETNDALQQTLSMSGAADETAAAGQACDQEECIGRTIGSYRVLARLGQGGMGEVFRVSHELIDCQRALKTLRPQLAAHPEAVKRFLREAQASVRHLSHPNLVTVYDVSRDQDMVYLVMELVDGVDLSRLVERDGPIAPRRAAEFMRQAAAGLQFAHQRGYVHRDIKPHNIMVTVRDEVKILDLGLVRVLERTEDEDQQREDDARPAEVSDFQQTVTFFRTRLTDNRALLGTLPYMAPEQAADAGQADEQCDIYSLGCTFYYLLTGRHAFPGSSVEEVLRKHLAGDYVPLRQARPDVPESLEPIVTRMLHRDRRERFTSASQVETALQQWLEGPPIRVRLKDADELQQGLVRLGLISEDDWRTALSAARRSADSRLSVESRGWSTTLSMPPEDAHPAIILQKLQELQSSRGGQKYGLSEFQVRMILNENADLLRLPHHVLLDQIGRGWKGEIYKARNVELNRTETVRLFPVKSLQGLGSKTAERLQTFREHARHLSELRELPLARVYGGELLNHRIHGEMVLLSGEYIVGESLETYVQSRVNDPQRWPTLTWFVEQWSRLARALHVAHERGLLHLDITHRTLRVDRDGRLRLTDLGVAGMLREPPERKEAWLSRSMAPAAAALAADAAKSEAEVRGKTTDTLAQQLAPTGTPEVLAPELLRDPRNVSPAADLYSCGCCMFYLLTGSYPFTAEGSASAALGHLTRSPWDSPVAGRVPHRFKPLLERLLAKRPEERYSNAGELAATLDQLRSAGDFPADSRLSWTDDPARLTSAETENDGSLKTGWLQRLWSSLGGLRAR